MHVTGLCLFVTANATDSTRRPCYVLQVWAKVMLAPSDAGADSRCKLVLAAICFFRFLIRVDLVCR